MKDFDPSSIEITASGMDAFFTEPAKEVPVTTVKTASAGKGRVKVASLSQLDGFVRTASDQLINKSTKDLWSLQKASDGDYYIERLFNDTGTPIKG